MAVFDRVETEPDRVRTAEVVAALSFATDLGMGFPFEHGLETTLMTMRLADLLGVDTEIATDTSYASLLLHTGCTTDADLSSRIFVGGLTVNMAPVESGSPRVALAGALRAVTPPDVSSSRRLYERARRMPTDGRFRKPHYAALCEVAEMLAERLGLPSGISRLFSRLTERWDENSVLKRAEGDEIPLPLRIAHVARDAAYQRLIHEPHEVVGVVRSRAGKAFDPAIAHQFAEAAGEVMSAADQPAWESVLAAEPRPWLELSGVAIDRALGAMGDFSDLASPYLSGHAAGVAELSARAGHACGFAPAEVTQVRRAALLHDLGRVGVHPGVWQKEGRLSVDDREQIRLHPYHTERILDRSPFLARIGAVACCHHERSDGSGYHRRLKASSLSPALRLLASVDAFHAMLEPRAHPVASSTGGGGGIDQEGYPPRSHGHRYWNPAVGRSGVLVTVRGGVCCSRHPRI